MYVRNDSSEKVFFTFGGYSTIEYRILYISINSLTISQIKYHKFHLCISSHADLLTVNENYCGIATFVEQYVMYIPFKTGDEDEHCSF